MSHWNSGSAKAGQAVVIVICGAGDGDDAEPIAAVYAIPLQGGSEAEYDEMDVADSDDYMYIDVEKCAKA